MAVLAVAETRIAVLWCRSALLGEVVPGPRALRFGWREIEFLQLAFPVLLLAWLLGLLVAVGVKAAIPAGTIMAGSVLPDRPPLLSDLACLFVLSLVLGRFVLGFPMAASDRPGGALRASWHLTRGNAWRLAGGLAILLLPATGLQLAVEHLSLVLAEDELSPVAIGFGLLWDIVDFAVVAVLMVFASYAYALLTAPLPRSAPGPEGGSA